MSFPEIIAVCFRSHVHHTDTLRGQNVDSISGQLSAAHRKLCT